MSYKDLQLRNADGNLSGIMSSQNADLTGVDVMDREFTDYENSDDLEDPEDLEEVEPKEYEYFVEEWEEFVDDDDEWEEGKGKAKRKAKRKQRKVRRKGKQAARKTKRAVKATKKKPTGKRAKRLTKKAAVATAKKEAYQTSSSRAEAKAKISAAKQQLGTKGQKFFGKVGQKLKAVGLGPQRIAMIALIKMNAFGLASGLKESRTKDPAKYKKARDSWFVWGGARGKFDNYIDQGAKKKPLKIKWKKSKAADGETIDELIYDPDQWSANADDEWKNFEPATTTALVASATPFIVVLIKLISQKKKEENVDPETLKSLETENEEQASEISKLQTEQNEVNNLLPEEERDPGTEGGLFSNKNLIIGGLVLLGVAVLIAVVKSKRN